MTEIEKAIEQLEMFVECEDYYKQNYRVMQPPELLFPALKLGIEALREKEKRDENIPLTLDELCGMKGKSVYITVFENDNIPEKIEYGYWGVVPHDNHSVSSTYIFGTDACQYETLEEYGKTWFAYRYEIVS